MYFWWLPTDQWQCFTLLGLDWYLSKKAYFLFLLISCTGTIPVPCLYIRLQRLPGSVTSGYNWCLTYNILLAPGCYNFRWAVTSDELWLQMSCDFRRAVTSDVPWLQMSYDFRWDVASSCINDCPQQSLLNGSAPKDFNVLFLIIAINVLPLQNLYIYNNFTSIFSFLKIC